MASLATMAVHTIAKEVKSCCHECYPSNLPNCCSCSDFRPISPDGYKRYVDGVGFTTIAERDDGYCPVCNTKNHDKWMARVERETKKKKEEDEARLVEEMAKAKLKDEDTERAKRKGNDGEHRVEYLNGDVYVGGLKDGAPHGKGRMEYGDNDMDIISYEGDWIEGKHNGIGKKVWIDDMYYEGGWKDSMMHGKGVCHQNEVDVMEGLFEEDELVG